MDADGLIGTVSCSRGLSRDWSMVVGGLAVETTVPAGLKTDVGVVHSLQIECIDGPFPPNVGEIIADDLGNSIVVADIKDVPLFKR